MGSKDTEVRDSHREVKCNIFLPIKPSSAVVLGHRVSSMECVAPDRSWEMGDLVASDYTDIGLLQRSRPFASEAECILSAES